MRSTLICFWLMLAVLLPETAWTLIEAPHNRANGIGCGCCHDPSLPKSPFWDRGVAPYPFEVFCADRCHSSGAGPSCNTNAPAAKTHSSINTSSSRATWGYDCIVCHKPHAHEQNNWDARNYTAGSLYLATGYLTGPPVYDGGVNTTTFGIDSALGREISFKGDWDEASLMGKSGLFRGALLIPNEYYPTYNYAIIDLTPASVTVRGNLTTAPWVPLIAYYPFRVIYGQYIRRYVDKNGTTGDPADDPRVTFHDRTGSNSFADDETAVGTDADPTVDGICQVCHEDTGHWSAATPAGDKHFSAWICTECHEHLDGFGPSWPDHDSLVTVPAFCQTCHNDTVFNLHGVDPDARNNCSRCHKINDNLNLVGSLPYAYLDTVPHLGKDKDMVTGGAVQCDNCHHGQFGEHVADDRPGVTVPTHDMARLGYDTSDPQDGGADQWIVCDACHYADVVQEHATQRDFTCSTCHESAVGKVIDAISHGMTGSTIFCDDCHNSDAGEPNGNLVGRHHLTSYAANGDCTHCHVVGPGERGPHRAPCWYCHGDGKPGDPQRDGTDKHANAPAITADSVDDFRVCFSCHLDGGQGFRNGVTPLVTPMHGLPSEVYWPYGYYRDQNNQWQAPQAPDVLHPTATDPNIPANLEGDPDKWREYPGWRVLNYLGVKKNFRASVYLGQWADPVRIWASDFLQAVVGKVDYRKQDYPTVPISMGGNFDVPSFDGTGTIGKPTGSGSVKVNIETSDAVDAGAKWRLDGGEWKDSGATETSVSDRANHLVEFKPMAGWDEPPPIEITVENGLLTELNVDDATYKICPDDCRLQVTRIGGDTALSFYWTRPEQDESFQIDGWTSGSIKCELWRESAGELVAAEGFATMTGAGGNTCRLFKTGATPAGNYDLVLRATGSSCFGNSIDLPLAITVTAAGAPSPVGQIGIINDTYIDSLTLPTIGSHDFLHLAGNLYVRINTYLLYGSYTCTLSVFTIDSQGTITALATENLSITALTTKIIRVSDTLIAVIYNDVYGRESHLKTVAIVQINDDIVITENEDYLLHTDSISKNAQIFPYHDNNSLFIVTWLGWGNYIEYTGLLAVQIDHQSGVITPLPLNEPSSEPPPYNRTLPNKGLNWQGNIVHVAGDTYAFAMANEVKIFKVNASGEIDTSGPSYQYEAAADSWVVMVRVSDDVYAVVYPLKDGVGYFLKTISISDSDSGVIFRTINTYLFEPCVIKGSLQLALLTDSVIGINYIGGCIGWYENLKTIEITDDGRIMTPPLDVLEIQGVSGMDSKLLRISDDIVAFLLQKDMSQGAEFNGVKTFAIGVDKDADGIVDRVDTCPNDAENDLDNDGLCGDVDICPAEADNDSDGDGFCMDSSFNNPSAGGNDNCPGVANTDQVDDDCDGVGDACDPAIDFSLAALPLANNEARLSVDYRMAGVNGFIVERKAEACDVNPDLNFTPLTTVYTHDDFAQGIDQNFWTIGTRASNGGSADVSWEKGAVKLHTATPGGGISGTDGSSWIGLKHLDKIIGDGDFDIQVDFSMETEVITEEQHFNIHLQILFPATGGGENYFVAQRHGGPSGATRFYATAKVDGVVEPNPYTSTVTTALSGKLRMVRRNRYLAAYGWDGAEWIEIFKHSQPFTADLVPTRVRISQIVKRIEPEPGQDITTFIDNFRLNTSGGMPVARLQLDMDDVWHGVTDEVRDATGEANHGTAFGGAATVYDSERGTVGSFDGQDDYVKVPHDGSINPSEAIAVALWAKSGTETWNSTGALISKRSSYIMFPHAGTKWLSFLVPVGDLQNGFEWKSVFFDLSTLSTPEVDFDIRDWHHYVGTYDSKNGQINLYVDGALRLTNQLPLPCNKIINPDTGALYIGLDNGFNAYFAGQIDDVRIFDRALNPVEIKALYNDWLQFKDTGLVEGTPYCYRVSPFKSGGCANRLDHAEEIPYTAEGNTPPSTPVNALPLDGATDVAFLPILTASVFFDPDGDIFQASQWRISGGTGAAFDDEMVYDSEVVYTGDSHNVTVMLPGNATYYWKARYQDSKDEWSAWSSETAFFIPNNPPDTPTNSSPADGAINQSSRLTLTASDFVDGDSGDTHFASQWQVRINGGNYGDADSYDSGVTAATSSHTLSLNLLFNGVYFWKVRYQDNSGNWSAYSDETSFATVSSAVSYWKFDEGVNSTAADSVGPNTGTLQNGAGWTVGVSGNALMLDGIDDYVSTGNLNYISTGTAGEYSISIWIKFDTIKQSFFFGDEQNGNGGVMMETSASGNIQTYKGGYRTSSFQVLAGQWYHIVFVQNAAGIDLYVNGVFIQQLAAAAYRHNETSAVSEIGRFPLGGRYTDADIDEFVVFNRALNAPEVKILCEEFRVAAGISSCQ